MNLHRIVDSLQAIIDAIERCKCAAYSNSDKFSKNGADSYDELRAYLCKIAKYKYFKGAEGHKMYTLLYYCPSCDKWHATSSMKPIEEEWAKNERLLREARQQGKVLKNAPKDGILMRYWPAKYYKDYASPEDLKTLSDYWQRNWPVYKQLLENAKNKYADIDPDAY